MKKIVAILLVAELLVAYFILAPTCILRQEQVRAFAAWHDSPTPETIGELDRQSRITQLHRLGFSVVVFGAMAGVTLFAVRFWRQRHPDQRDLKNETLVA